MIHWRRTLRIAGFLGGSLLLLLLVVAVGLFFASQQAPGFYQEALKADPVRAEQASREMLDQASTLTREIQSKGTWEAVFSTDQINGWLAVDRVNNHPDLLPKEFNEPRVAIMPGSATIACEYEGQNFSSVLSIEVDAYVSEPNVIAVRIHRVLAGALPVPLGNVLDAIRTAAREMDVPVEWRQVDGDPVCLIPVTNSDEEGGQGVRLETLELRSNEIYLAGRTQELKSSGEKPKAAPAKQGAQAGKQRNRKRRG